MEVLLLANKYSWKNKYILNSKEKELSLIVEEICKMGKSIGTHEKIVESGDYRIENNTELEYKKGRIYRYAPFYIQSFKYFTNLKWLFCI